MSDPATPANCLAHPPADQRLREAVAAEREACAQLAEKWRDENKAAAAKARKFGRARGENGMADMLDGAALECNALAQEIRARTALAAPLDDGWLPIGESVRKYNTVLGFMPSLAGGYQAVIWWDKQFRTDGWDDDADDVKYVGGWTAGVVGSFGHEEYREEFPTHYRPLPSAPTSPILSIGERA